MINMQEYKDIIANLRQHEGDTGSAPVQIAFFTMKINNLTEHLKIHKKDKHSRVGLYSIISKRRALLDYLNKRQNDLYKSVLDLLNIRK